MMTDSFRVTIGCPTTDFVHKNFMTSLVSMVKLSKLNLGMSVTSGSSICQNRITAVNLARKNEAKYIFFIDNDMSFPHYTVDRLVYVAEEKNLDILGCGYLFKTPPHNNMAVPLDRNKEQVLTGLDEMDRLPTGLMLIRMSVFDRLPEPWFIYKPAVQDGLPTIQTEDYVFSDNARAAGIPIFMDSIMSLDNIIHWGSPIGVQWIAEPPGYKYVTDLPGYGVG